MVDELMILDIDATVNGLDPDFKLIKNIALESRMPLCYGGGIKNEIQAKRIINLGFEKISISSGAIKDPYILSKIGNHIGLQSVILVIDVKQNIFGNYDIYTNNGKLKHNINFYDYLKKINQIGIGEIVINSIDKDGTMEGYDIKLITKVREICDTPLTALGGAGKLDDMKYLINKFKIIGASAGSLFVFKGKYKAVLINYPDKLSKENILY